MWMHLSQDSVGVPFFFYQNRRGTGTKTLFSVRFDVEWSLRHNSTMAQAKKHHIIERFHATRDILLSLYNANVTSHIMAGADPGFSLGRGCRCFGRPFGYWRGAFAIKGDDAPQRTLRNVGIVIATPFRPVREQTVTTISLTPRRLRYGISWSNSVQIHCQNASLF